VTPPATGANPAVLLLTLLTVGYLLACAVWPYRPCSRCRGTGRVRSPLGRSLRLCRRCNATGLRLRAGRHIWNWLRRTRRR
jgi:hypothetical protein